MNFEVVFLPTTSRSDTTYVVMPMTIGEVNFEVIIKIFKIL